MTAEELENIDRFLGENIMGWDNSVSTYWIKRAAFRPTRSIEQAMMCLEKTGKEYAFTKIFKNDGSSFYEVYIENDFLPVDHVSPTVTICLACQAWIERNK